MTIKFFSSVVCILLLTAAVRSDILTSIDGYKFEVSLKPQKELVMVGEPSFVDFEVRNLSNVVLGVLQGGDYRNEFGRPDSFDVKIFNSDGKLLPRPKTITMGGLTGFQKIAVGEKVNVRLYLSHWARIEKTGKYKIDVEKNLVVKKYDLNDIRVLDSLKKSIPVKLSTQIQVTPFDHRQMGRIVEGIGKQLVNGDSTAEKLVPFIYDERIIKYLVRAVEKNHWLMRNLSKFNDEKALNAIIKEIRNEKDEIRRNVSISLSQSVHPKASSYLLRMRSDESPAIRLDVVHFLGKKKTSESSKLLREMLNDLDERVRNESIRYLKERGQ